jgi:phosphate transport system substrate-binding protein
MVIRRKKMKQTVRIVSLALVLAFTASAQDVDTALKPYSKVDGVSGQLSSIGSDTLNNLMTFWAEGFKKQYPNVNIQIEGKGSSTAPPALIKGVAQLGPMSRAMKRAEIDEFESKYGYKPTELRVALDSLAVYVNKDCPLEELTMEQVDAIFGKGRKLGYREDIKTWGQLGVQGDWATRPISLYGRNSASGTYGFFKEHALKNGDFKDSVKEQPGSASVVLGITEDRYSIGYSGVGYSTSGVKRLRLASKAGQKAVAAEAANVYDETYPLWRFLYVYVNRPPSKPLDPLVREVATFIFSREGQHVVVKDGFYPLPAAVAEQEIKKLQ